MFSSLPIVATLIIVSNLIFSFKGFKNDIFFNKYRFEVKKIKEGDLIAYKFRIFTCKYYTFTF